MAMFYVGNCYIEGCGTSIDGQKTFEWYLKAAEKGFTEAMYRIGVYYLNGINVRKNLKMGIEWCIKASKKGHNGATNELKRLNKMGILVLV